MYSQTTHGALEGGHSDTKGAVSALHFALVNSAKYDVPDTTLLVEIQQLGLPKENADAVTEAFRGSKDSLQESFREKAYKVDSHAPAPRNVALCALARLLKEPHALCPGECHGGGGVARGSSARRVGRLVCRGVSRSHSRRQRNAR